MWTTLVSLDPPARGGTLNPYHPFPSLQSILRYRQHHANDAADGGFFVFGDLSVKIDGEFRLKFTLFEMRR